MYTKGEWKDGLVATGERVIYVDGVKYHLIVKHLQSYIPVKDFKGYTQIVPLNYKEGK